MSKIYLSFLSTTSEVAMFFFVDFSDESWSIQWYAFVVRKRKEQFSRRKDCRDAEVKFTLHTLTPLLLAGADQKKAKVAAPKQPFRGWEKLLYG